jgi:hypothetical protein
MWLGVSIGLFAIKRIFFSSSWFGSVKIISVFVISAFAFQWAPLQMDLNLMPAAVQPRTDAFMQCYVQYRRMNGSLAAMSK